MFDLFGNPRTAIMALCTGARKRVGFGFRGRRCAYNLVVAPRGDLVHGVEFNLDALRALHIQIVTRQPTLPIDELSEASADHTAEYFAGACGFVASTACAGVQRFRTLAH